MSKTYTVTFPVEITIKEGVNYETPISWVPLDELDEEGIVRVAQGILYKAVEHGTSPYLISEFMKLRMFNNNMLKDGRIKIKEN